MFKFDFVCITFIFFLSIYTVTHSAWRMDRRPKVMGEKLSHSKISPLNKRVQRRIVMWHNYFRIRVVPSASNMLLMKWHNDAASTAQRWADTCMFLKHDNTTGRHVDAFGSCGQNIFVSTHQVPWFFAINTWYLENQNFTYGSTKNKLKVIGHYTQMIWATTHRVGCAFNKCNRIGNEITRSYFIYVCNYCPIGNKPASLGRPYKVGKPCKMCPRQCHRKKLCKNSCPAADYWSNCRQLRKAFPSWLCHTSDTPNGRLRFDSCKASCTCHGKLYD